MRAVSTVLLIVAGVLVAFGSFGLYWCFARSPGDVALFTWVTWSTDLLGGLATGVLAVNLWRRSAKGEPR